MQAHPLELRRGERARACPRSRWRRRGDRGRAPAPPGARASRRRPTARRASRGRAREIGHAARVADRPGRLQVGEVGDRLQRGLELVVGEHDLERRLRVDHRRPARHRVDVARTASGASAQNTSTSAGSNCVPLRSRATATAASTPPLRWKTSTTSARVTSARRDQDLLALGLRRHALAVPALERLVEAVAHLRGRGRARPPARSSRSQWFSIASLAARRPSPTNLTPRRARSTSPRPAPTRLRTSALPGRPARSTRRVSALSARSSPNHFACSYAST